MALFVLVNSPCNRNLVLHCTCSAIYFGVIVADFEAYLFVLLRRKKRTCDLFLCIIPYCIFILCIAFFFPLFHASVRLGGTDILSQQKRACAAIFSFLRNIVTDSYRIIFTLVIHFIHILVDYRVLLPPWNNLEPGRSMSFMIT